MVRGCADPSTNGRGPAWHSGSSAGKTPKHRTSCSYPLSHVPPLPTITAHRDKLDRLREAVEALEADAALIAGGKR